MSCTKQEEKYLLLGKSNVRRKVTLGVIAVSNLCAWCCISLIGPFFPLEAEKKGVSETVIGFIYSSSELVIFLTSPIYGKLGILETVTGLGFMLGPAVGAGFYEVGGFGLPFWILGSVVFLCGCASCAVLPAQHHMEERTGPSSLTLLRSPLAWYGSNCLVAGVIGISFSAPIFAKHLVRFNLNQGLIGLIFLITPAVYSFTAPFWGFLLDKKVSALTLVTAGLICASVNMLFYGPAPFFTFVTPVVVFLKLLLNIAAFAACVNLLMSVVSQSRRMLWLTFVTLVLTGITLAPAIVSGMRCVVQGARDLGFKDESGTFGLVGGIIQSSNSLGLLIGPTISGVLADNYGFRWAMTACAFLILLPVLCYSPYLILTAHRALKKYYFPSNEVTK